MANSYSNEIVFKLTLIVNCGEIQSNLFLEKAIKLSDPINLIELQITDCDLIII